MAAEGHNVDGNLMAIGRDHGHYFVKKTFGKPVYCHHCCDKIWGMLSQGYACESTLRIVVVVVVMPSFLCDAQFVDAQRVVLVKSGGRKSVDSENEEICFCQFGNRIKKSELFRPPKMKKRSEKFSKITKIEKFQ